MPGRRIMATGRLRVGIVDVDRQKAALIVVGIEERQLLVAVNHVDRVVDVEHDRLGRRRVAGAVEIDHHAAEPDDDRAAPARSPSRDTVGCAHRSVPLSGSRPQASLKAGSARRRSRSSASS